MFYQCAEALDCSDQNLVEQATFCSVYEEVRYNYVLMV